MSVPLACSATGVTTAVACIIIVNPPFNQEGRTIHSVQVVGVWMYKLSVWANRSRLKAQLFPVTK